MPFAFTFWSHVVQGVSNTILSPKNVAAICKFYRTSFLNLDIKRLVDYNVEAFFLLMFVCDLGLYKIATM